MIAQKNSSAFSEAVQGGGSLGFLKYRVLLYVLKRGDVTKQTLHKKFPRLKDELSIWSGHDQDDCDLFVYDATKNATMETITYNITKSGRAYIDAVSRELFFAVLAASVSLLGAFLGALLPSLLSLVPGTPALPPINS